MRIPQVARAIILNPQQPQNPSIHFVTLITKNIKNLYSYFTLFKSIHSNVTHYIEIGFI